ncbi:MAG: DUF4845 domain-containing protein [Pseudomonadota bacterium]|jgi:hypothetical protein|nr:DUF4845 domain-containing protein [Pseudomonadota bacterium]
MNNAATRFQHGASFTSVLVGLIVAGIFLSAGFKLFGPYWEHATIKSIIAETVEDPAELAQPVREIRRNFDKKFLINQVSLPERDALQVRLEEGILYFDLAYEVRVPMFYNVDAVVKFEDHYQVVKP